MAEVLDYSSGHPAPAAVLAAGYGGVVRYAGTQGRGKNLTRAEAQAMLAAGVPIGLVYEAGAGWMLGGTEVGAGAARAVLADANQCGVGVRAVYFAADFDVTSTAQMVAVERCLDGAAQVLGRGRVGVYGEADVIDACLGSRHATWGWQTRAWSAGRVSSRAHLLQQVGYVYPGGVQCDRNTVLRRDWGQWPAPALIPIDTTGVEDMDKAELTQLMHQAARDGVAAAMPDAIRAAMTRRYDKGADTPREALDELDELPGRLDAMDARLARIEAAVTGKAAGQ